MGEAVNEDSTWVDARLKLPYSLIVSGSSQSGKSTFVKNLLLNSGRLFDTQLQYVVVFSGSQDETFKSISTDFPITFVEGLPSDFDLYIKSDKVGLFIIDDLETKVSVNQDVLHLFTTKCHHCNVSVILIMQNLYSPGNERIGMLRNATYLCVFRSPLDQSIVWNVARRINPSKTKLVMRVISSILERYRYVFITGHPRSPSSIRFRTDLFNPLYQRCFIL